MPDFLASYDLSSSKPPHSEFLKQAVKNGWRLWAKGATEWYRLPNTTLDGTFTTIDAAIAALKATQAATATAIGAPVAMPKYIVTPSNEARFASDERQKIT